MMLLPCRGAIVSFLAPDFSSCFTDKNARLPAFLSFLLRVFCCRRPDGVALAASFVTQMNEKRILFHLLYDFLHPEREYGEFAHGRAVAARQLYGEKEREVEKSLGVASLKAEVQAAQEWLQGKQPPVEDRGRAAGWRR